MSRPKATEPKVKNTSTLVLSVPTDLCDQLKAKTETQGYTLRHVTNSLFRLYVDGAVTVPIPPEQLPSKLLTSLSELANDPKKMAELQNYITKLNAGAVK